jgi:phosphoserine aminotransferase
MAQKINFNAGPAHMPPEVLYEASAAVRQYKKTGLSILELPHRGKEFLAIIEESKALVKKLCGIGDEYEVLWLQGGGRMQFCMVPMNFAIKDKTAGYIDSGYWAHDAASYARHYTEVLMLGSSKDSGYNHLPTLSREPAGLSYIHVTTNNTIYGTQWHSIPDMNAPLIGDMSSDIFSTKIDYSKYAMFYAAVQKNLGAAGTAMVVLRKDMLGGIPGSLPPMLSYAAQAKENSILNTANVFGIYVSLLMLRWLDARGIDNIETENKRKAALLYDAIDSSETFTAYVQEKSHRSLMNVCFTVSSPQIEKAFLELCEKNDIIGIQGHRSAGGFRASLYNAVTYDEVKELVRVMGEFNPNPAPPVKRTRP